MRFILAVLFVLLGLLGVGCEDKNAVRVKQIHQDLIGTWLREIEYQGGNAQRVLVLQADGKFSEVLIARFADGRRAKETRAGEWSYDGTNLKRRYTHEDGRQLAGNMNFATFQLIAFDGKHFVGKNHSQGEVIEYRRVADGTVPKE